MRRTAALCGIALLGCACAAQQGVYLRPHFEKKWHLNPGDGFSLPAEFGHDARVVPMRAFSPQGLLFGFGLGFKARTWMLEMAFMEDEALFGASLQGEAYLSGAGVFGHGEQSSFYTGKVASKLSLTASFRLWGGGDQIARDRSARWECWAQFSGHLLSSAGATEGLLASGSWYAAPDRPVSWELREAASLPDAFGGMAGVMLKGYNRKGHSIVNVSLGHCWLFDNQDMLLARMSFRVEPDGRAHTGYLKASGSGILLGVSKDFYLNNLWHGMKRVLR